MKISSREDENAKKTSSCLTGSSRIKISVVRKVNATEIFRRYDAVKHEDFGRNVDDFHPRARPHEQYLILVHRSSGMEQGCKEKTVTCVNTFHFLHRTGKNFVPDVQILHTLTVWL